MRGLSLSGVFMEKIYLGFSSKSSDVPMVEESMRPCPEGTLCLEFLFSAIFEGGSLRALEGRFAA